MSSRKKATSSPKKKAATTPTKKAATPTTTSKRKRATKKKDSASKSLSQQFADITENVDVSEGRPSRAKKEVSRFEVDDLRPVEVAQVEIQKGSGTKLKELKPIREQFRVLNGDEPVVKKLHHLLYGRAGKTHETKKNIFKWNGLASRNKKENKEKMLEKLNGWKITDLRTLVKLLCLGNSSGTSKEELALIVASFLVSPKEKDLVEKEKKKKPSKRRRTTSSASESEVSDTSDASESEPEEKRGRKRGRSPSRSTSRSRSASRSKSPSKGKGKKAGTSKRGRSVSASPKRSRSPVKKEKITGKRASPSPARGKAKSTKKEKAKGNAKGGKSKAKETKKKGSGKKK